MAEKTYTCTPEICTCAHKRARASVRACVQPAGPRAYITRVVTDALIKYNCTYIASIHNAESPKIMPEALYKLPNES